MDAAQRIDQVRKMDLIGREISKAVWDIEVVSHRGRCCCTADALKRDHPVPPGRSLPSLPGQPHITFASN